MTYPGMKMKKGIKHTSIRTPPRGEHLNSGYRAVSS